MGWEGVGFISMVDLYIAYRKAKVDMYYERDHVTAIKFCNYEEHLDANLTSLLAVLNDPEPTWMHDLKFIGDYAYIPKSLDPIDPNKKPDQISFIHSDPDAAWKALSQKCPHEAKFRLIGRHPVAFHVLSALWIRKVGHQYDGVLRDSAYGSRLRRKPAKEGKPSEPSNTSLGSFRPYSFGFRAWRENGLGTIHKALDDGKSVIAVKIKPSKPIIQHGLLRFGILICSELTNIDFRQPLRGKVDALFVPEWNKDTNTFASLVEASALDIHCFVVQVNNRTYGDCRIRAPYAEQYQRDVVRVKGGEMDYFVIGKLDVPGLRAFQSNFRSPAGGSCKPVPDGFESAPGRRVRPSSK